MRKIPALVAGVIVLGLCMARASRAAEATSVTTAPQGVPVTIDADRMTFDKVTNIATGEGHVIIKYKDATLRADRVKLNSLTKEVWADGDVRLNRQHQEWVAPSLFYNLETRELRTEDVRGYFEPLYMHAAEVRQGSTNEYVFAKSTLTTCDSLPPHYRVDAKHGEIWPGDRVVLYNVTVRVGEVPVAWFPMLIFSLKGDQPPVLFSLGDSTDMGFYVLTTTYWKLNKDLGLVVHLDERTRRGFSPGIDLNYKLGAEGAGSLSGYYLNDANAYLSTNSFTGTDIPINRFRAAWDHRQSFSNNVDLIVVLDKLSDRAVEMDFFHRQFSETRDPESVVNVTKHGDGFALSLLARPQINGFEPMLERYPEAKLTLNRTRLGTTPFFFESTSSVGQFNNDPGSSGVTNLVGNAVRADTFHQLVMPMVAGGWLSVVPRAGVRGQYYSRGPGTVMDQADVQRVVFDLGCETSFKLSRTWPGAQNKLFEVDGLRHVLQPFADYQWVPRPDKRPNNLFQFDTTNNETLLDGAQLSLTRWSPLSFPENNSIDDINRINTVRFGLRQSLQTRRDGKPWDLIELTGWTDYLAEHEPGQANFNNGFGSVKVRPWSWVEVDVDSRYDFSVGTMEELNTALHVGSSNNWSLGVGTRYIRGDSNLVSVHTAYRLTRNWAVEMVQRVDMQDGTWEEQQYGLRQDTHDWSLDYGVRYQEQRSGHGSNQFTVFFAVTLKAFPSTRFGVD